jgi:hypothetical protein
MKTILVAGILLAFGAGCGGSPCANIAGTWAVSGDCGPDTCVISQTGCSTTFACSAGSAAYTGSVNGDSVSYSGTSATGAPGSCSGTVSGAVINGTCVSQGNPACAFTATKH